MQVLKYSEKITFVSFNDYFYYENYIICNFLSVSLKIFLFRNIIDDVVLIIFLDTFNQNFNCDAENCIFFP